jgi:hypothetical protein
VLRKKKIMLGLVMFFIMSALNTSMHSKQNTSQLITISTKNHLSIYIKPGPNYDFMIHLLFLSFKRPATIACWLETTKGEYVDTIFVSHNAAKGEWYAHPEGQPGALPVWSFIAAGKKNDAVSGATFKFGEKFITNDSSNIPAGSYIVKFEANIPYDYNEAFPINLPKNDPRFSGYNGQPSLIYEGIIEIGKGSASTFLKLIGAGSTNGKDGEIHDLYGIISALKIIDSVEVHYEE